MSLTQEFVREIFTYDPESGHLYWTPAGSKSMAGKRAGYIVRKRNKNYVYRAVQIKNREFLEHRVIWLYVNGDPIPAQIDHKNRDATDNRIANMRDGSDINNYNFSRPITNTTGAVGVTRHKGTGKYQASVKFKGKNYYLGLHEKVEDAAEAARAFREILGFDPGHGTSTAHYHCDAGMLCKAGEE